MRAEVIFDLQETGMARAFLACALMQRRIAAHSVSMCPSIARAWHFTQTSMLLKKFAREQRALGGFAFTRANQCRSDSPDASARHARDHPERVFSVVGSAAHAE
jgi:hypothetical protein